MLGNRKDIEVASAGVHAVRGQPPSLYAVQVCEEEGVDISGLRSQPLTAALVDRATHIFAMTGAHLETIQMLFPDGAEKSFLLREFEEPDTTVWRDVPDPIGLGRDVYEACARTIKNALPSVLAFVEQSELGVHFAWSTDLCLPDERSSASNPNWSRWIDISHRTRRWLAQCRS